MTTNPGKAKHFDRETTHMQTRTSREFGLAGRPISRITVNADGDPSLTGPETRETADTLTRAELQEAVHSCCRQLSHAEARAIVDAVLDEIRAVLAAGEHIHLHGFGTFRVREKHARIGRNPRNGDAAEICARRVVTFKASPAMVARINGKTTSGPGGLSAITDPDTN